MAKVVERSLTLRACRDRDRRREGRGRGAGPDRFAHRDGRQQRRVRFDADQVAAGGTTDGAGRAELRKLPAGEKLAFRAIRMGFLSPEVSKTLREGDNGVLVLKIERRH